MILCSVFLKLKLAGITEIYIMIIAVVFNAFSRFMMHIWLKYFACITVITVNIQTGRPE